jgi:hypothetical protein
VLSYIITSNEVKFEQKIMGSKLHVNIFEEGSEHGNCKEKKRIEFEIRS